MIKVNSVNIGKARLLPIAGRGVLTARAYPTEHYAFWQVVRAQAKVAEWNAPLPSGSMGENLSLSGLLEADIWIGDFLRRPNCTLAISERGVDFESLDGEKVHLLFLLVSPPDRPGDHLRALENIGA